MNFCEKLQMIRKSNNLSQEQLAEKLNVSRQAVSKWESGQGYPEIDKLIHLSNIFEISLDELLKKETIDNNAKSTNITPQLKEPNIFSETTSLSIFPKEYRPLYRKIILATIFIIILIFMCILLMFVFKYLGQARY
jgi:transcriptional regulator with XRE-family HTH domain